MPYDGPSKGCRRCRRLKVKCDQITPCGRCRKGFHICEYTSDFDRLHRDQNAYAKDSATKKWRQRAELSPDVRPSEPAQPHLGLSLYELAYRRFCFDFISPFPVGLRKLPQLLYKAFPDSCLCTIVAAVAYVNYDGRCNSPEARQEGRKSYGIALKKFADSMSDNKVVQSDESLMVVFLMSLYELLTSSSRDGSYLAHLQGTQSIVFNRDGAALSDENGCLALLCSHLVMWHLAESRPPPETLTMWVEQIPFESPQKKQLISLIIKSAGVCARLKARCDSEPSVSSMSPISDEAIVQEASAIDQELQSWASDLPDDWSPVRRDHINHIHRPKWSKGLLSIPGGPTHMRIYSSLLAASDWNIYRSVRVYIWLYILKIVAADSSGILGNTSALKSRGISILLEISVDIAETIPYSIGLSIDGSSDPAFPKDVPGLCAYKVFWSAYQGVLCHRASMMQDYVYLQRAVWFGGMLRFLKDTIGISKAEIFLEGKPLVDL